MILKRLALSAWLLLAVHCASAYQAAAPSSPPASSAQAVAILQNSLAAFGIGIPADSTATGTVTTVAGSLTENGNILILTRGMNQTLEQLQTPSGSTIVYSAGQAAQINGSVTQYLSAERALSCQSGAFPLPLIAAALSNPDTIFQYIGLETLNGQSTGHIRAIDTYASQPNLQSLADYSARDIWFNATSGLPARISFVRRDAGGASPGIAVDIFFSNYQNFQGVLYPMNIQESLNGTPWATITIQTVRFNTGLSDASFPIQQAGATP
jgi:hypothetical protein